MWDCDHLIDDRLSAPGVPALEGSRLQSFAYDGKTRVLEIEFRVTAPFTHGDIPLPPPPRVIQYYDAPRYVFTKLISLKTARKQERSWEDNVRPRFRCQTVRTICRLPRIRRFVEARNVRRFHFEDYVAELAAEERQSIQLIVAGMKILLLSALSPKRVAGLGGLLECQSCGSVGANVNGIRHRNCLWGALLCSENHRGV